jgi:hypothetical protein
VTPQYFFVRRFFFSTLDPGGTMVLPSVIRPVACAEVPVQAAGFCFHSPAKGISCSVLKALHHDEVMTLWRKTMVPALAALAAFLLGAASVSGLDQMANSRAANAASVTVIVPAAAADGKPPLRQMVMLGLADGSLPGGFPYDELREEKYDENYQESLRVGPATPA